MLLVLVIGGFHLVIGIKRSFLYSALLVLYVQRNTLIMAVARVGVIMMEVVMIRVAIMIEVICIVLMIIVELLFRLIVVISIATKISRTMAPLPFLLISPASLIYQHDEIFQFLFHQTNDPILSVNLFIQLLHLILVPLLHALHFGFIMNR